MVIGLSHQTSDITIIYRGIAIHNWLGSFSSSVIETRTRQGRHPDQLTCFISFADKVSLGAVVLERNKGVVVPVPIYAMMTCGDMYVSILVLFQKP